MLAKEGREKRGGEEEEKARKKLAREKDAEVVHEAMAYCRQDKY